MLRCCALAHALGTRQANLLVKFHGIDLPTLPAAARREKWQDFTPPAARRSRRYRGLILHRRFQYDAFTPDNDPYEEHDFGKIEYDEQVIFWKFDYYDLDLSMMSPDPSDPAVTARVLTVMLADEY
jgi:Protein of unknown function (DUF3768).